MPINLNSLSVVIVAQAHNPSILNPDFLKARGIVDPSFTPKTVFCTPPVSQVSYQEGISIVAEFQKLQFVDEQPERIASGSPIADIAIKYIDVLPHVNYTAVGLNVGGYYPAKDIGTARRFVNDTFIKQGPWLSVVNRESTDTMLNFVYSYEEGEKRLLSINPAFLGQEGQQTSVILVGLNHHLDAGSGGIEVIKGFLANRKTTFDFFLKLTDKIFKGLEE